MRSHHAGNPFDKGLSAGYDERCRDGSATKTPSEIDAERGLPRGASVYVMGSSSIVEVAGLLAGGRQYLVVEERVALAPFEGKTFVSPARVELRVQRAGGALGITGSIHVEAHGECDRCLVDVPLPMDLEVDERVEPPTAHTGDPFDESNVLAGDRLDVADLTQQLVCSAVPFRLLCSQECKGLCSVCGANLNSEWCGCTGGITNGQS